MKFQKLLISAVTGEKPRRKEMKRSLLLGVLTISLLPMLLSAPRVATADFLWKFVKCGNEAVRMVPEGTTIKIDDVIASANAPVLFVLFFDDPTSVAAPTIMEVFLRRGGNVVSNFTGTVQGPNLFASCTTQQTGATDAVVSLTIVGSSALASE